MITDDKLHLFCSLENDYHTLAYIYFDNHHDYYQYHLPDDHYLHQGFWGLPWWSTDQDLGLSTSVQEIPQANGSATPKTNWFIMYTMQGTAKVLIDIKIHSLILRTIYTFSPNKYMKSESVKF